MRKRVLKVFFSIIIAIILMTSITVIALVFMSRNYPSLEKSFGKRYDSLVLKHVNIVDLEKDSVAFNKFVVIENGIITSITDSIPSEAKNLTQKELNGKYIMHGLADMHSHVFDPADLVMSLSYGVTHVRNMMGFPYHLKWREQSLSDQISGSLMTTSGPTINGPEDNPPLHLTVTNEAEIKQAIDKTVNLGYDFLKVYNGLPQESLKTLASYAKEKGIPFAGHPSSSAENDFILSIGFGSLEHVEEIFQAMLDFDFDTTKALDLCDRIKAADVPITLTLSAYNHLYRTVLEKDDFLKTIPIDQISPFIRYLGTSELEGWKNPTQSGYDWTLKKYSFLEFLVKELYKRDVTFLLGTDTGPNLTVHGWNVHREMDLLSKLGLSNRDILLSGTVYAADVLQTDLFSGTINAGSIANLIVLDSNPLEDLSTIETPDGIILRSKFFDTQELLSMRAFAKEHFRPKYISAGQFIDSILFN